jgi:phage/plasmid-like protein (TIGR03299 family)
MAHEVETMAYSKVEAPWHGLGVAVDPDLAPDEMLVKAGLDWTVSCQKLRTENGARVKHHRALVRDSDNRILDIVGPNYTPTQNSEAAAFFKKFTDAGKMTMETAGSLRYGERVFFLARLQEGFTLAGGDEVRGYLLLCSPHKFGKALTAMFTPVRVVCMNTLTMALVSGNKRFSMPHIKVFDAEVMAAAEQALSITHELMVSFQEKARFLSNVPFKSLDVQRYITTLFQPGTLGQAANDRDLQDEFKNTARLVYEAIEVQPGAELSKGTYWSALNAVTHVVDHKLGRVRDNAMYNAWFGQQGALKRRAVDLAIEFAKAA